MPFNIPDNNFSALIALPASATSAHSAAFDLGALADSGAGGDFTAECELLITAPALNATQLPAAATATYTLQQSTDGTNFTAIPGATGIIVQTGATTYGAAAAATARYRLPTTAQEFVRLLVTTASSPGDCSGASAQLQLLF